MELALRMGGIAIAALLVWAYTGWLGAWAWLATYLGLHLANFLFLTSAVERPAARHVPIAAGIYLLVLGSYLAMPVVLAVQPDPVLRFVGVVLIAVGMVYQIRRADRILWFIWAMLGLFAVCLLYVLSAYMPFFATPLAKIGAGAATVAGWTYIALAMLFARQSRLALEESSERLAEERRISAVGRVAGGVAHDFNNVLTVIKGNLELYDHAASADEKDAAIAECRAAAARAERMVQHLMIYARKAPQQTTRLDANEAMLRVFDMVSPRCPAQIEHIVQTAPHALPVRLDETQLVSALLHLSDNALHAMEGAPSGELMLLSALETVEEVRPMVDGGSLPFGRYAILQVRDTGSGILPDLLPRVVEPFFTTKPVGKGTGLGLSMVLGFCQESGGGFHLDSTAHGTVATLYLPLDPSPSPESHATAPMENAAPDGDGAENILEGDGIRTPDLRTSF